MRKKIDEALGNWEIESNRVKQSILEAKKTLQPKKVRRKSNPKWHYALFVALLTLMVGGFQIWQQNNDNSGPVTSNETPTPIEVNANSDAIPHEKTLQIIKYDYFYRNSSFMSEKRAEYHALMDIMMTYPILYHMEKYNYSFPKDREEHYRDRAAALFKTEMEDENFKNYFMKINEQHGISEEDYIEHYLFVLEKVNFMKNLMLSKNIGLVDGGFPSGEVEKEYEAILGITLDEWEKELEKEEAAIAIKAVEVPDTPLQEFIPQLQYGYNQEGEIVIAGDSFDAEHTTSPNLEWILEGFTSFLYDKVFTNDFKAFEALPRLNRVNLHEYVIIIENFKGTPAQKAYAKEALEFLQILQQTIDMEVKADFNIPK